MYEQYTKQFLEKRMLDRINSDIDKSEGSFTYDALSPAAVELAQTYIELDGILEKAFAQTSYGEWLEKRAAEYGVYRKPGTCAYGTITFYGADGTIIPAGTLVQTKAGLQYATLKQSVITSGYTTVEIEAVLEGTQYNIPAKFISDLPVQLTGITSLENLNPITGGTDIETESDFLQRLLLKVRKPATSGNIHHYKQWALEVPGIGDAIVFPLWKGPGTVKIIVIDSNRQPIHPEGDLMKRVTGYIEDNRPVGAMVTVDSAKKLEINITAAVELKNDYTIDSVRQEFRMKLIYYLKGITFIDDHISYLQIGKILLETPGVKECPSMTVNNGTDDVILEDDQCPVLNDIIITQLADQGV
ncbi:MAG: baseplate J/gp47 family protein [Bacillota bacterium]